MLKAFLNEQEGQDLVEYAVLLGSVALVCAVSLPVLTQSVAELWNTVQTVLGVQ